MKRRHRLLGCNIFALRGDVSTIGCHPQTCLRVLSLRDKTRANKFARGTQNMLSIWLRRGVALRRMVTVEDRLPPFPPKKPRRLLLAAVWLPALIVVLAAVAGCHALGVARAVARAEAGRPRSPDTGVRVGAEPFAHDVAGPACLMLHGFAATPQIFREMAQRLADAGISSRAILMPGHGTTIADFGERRKDDWVAAAEKAYEEMRAKYDTLYVVGFSMGGTVALNMAERRDVAGVVCMAPFLRITRRWFHVVRAESLSRFAKRVGFPRVVENIPIDVADKSVRPSVIHAGFTPIATSCSLFDLADETRANLSAIKCPILVMHGSTDRVADPRESARLMNVVSSRDKRLIRLDRSAHLIPMDYDKERAFAETIAFIRDKVRPAKRGE